MKKITNKILIVILLSICSISYSQEYPVYTGPDKTYMPVSVNSVHKGNDDGTIICWLEASNNGCLKSQKLDLSGLDIWTENGVLIETGLGSEINDKDNFPYIFSDDKGGAIMIYRKSYPNRDEILSRTISNNGRVQEKANIISSKLPGYNYGMSAVITSDNRIAVVWENFSEGDFDIHGQLLDLEGNKYWNKGKPLEICNYRYDQRRPAISCNENNNLLISWLDSRDNSEYVFDLFASIINADNPDHNKNWGGTKIFNNDIHFNSRKLTLFEHSSLSIDKYSFLVTFENSYDNLFNNIKILKIDSDLRIEWEKTIDNDSYLYDPYMAEIDNEHTGVFWKEISSDKKNISGIIMKKNGNIIWGGKNGSNITCEEKMQVLEKSLPFHKIKNGSYFKINTLYIPWVTKKVNELRLTKLNLTDGSVPCKNTELIREKISEGEFTSISANKYKMTIVYKLSDYIYASVKDISKQEFTKITEIPVIDNYPNPFNPSTKINFNIPNDGFVRLSVFDIAGRQVKEVVNEYKTKGEYHINFDGSNLSSGVYFYRLQINENTFVKKMTLLK